MWDIPNLSEAEYAAQARIYSSALQDIVLAQAGKGVVSGCLVSDGASGMSISVAAGVVQPSFALGHVNVSLTALSFTSANATNPRIDLVEVNTSGVPAVKTGVAAASPLEPELSNNSIKLAAVYIPPTITNITPGMISDRRVLIAISEGPAGADGATGTGIIVVDSGETIPAETPVGSLIFRRPL
jgi:hypothetical protein